MTTLVAPKNTYNPRGDAAKLLSYRPNGAVITDDDGAFLAVRPIYILTSSFDNDDKFQADEYTMAYLKHLRDEVLNLIAWHDGTMGEDSDVSDEEFVEVGARYMTLRILPLLERIRIVPVGGTQVLPAPDCGDSFPAFLYTPSGSRELLLGGHGLSTTNPDDDHSCFLKLTTMTRYTRVD